MKKLIVLILFVSAPLVICNAENPSLKIGVFVCLTGECSEWGTASLKGLQLAASEINQAGGVIGRKVELIIEDSQEGLGPSQAVTSFQKLLLQRDIKYFIGPTWTPAGLAIAPIASKQQGIIVTSPSLGVADFNEAGSNLFNSWPHDEIATRYLARWARENGLEKIAVMSSQQPWEFLQGRIFKDEFERLGGTVPLILEPLPTQRDLRVEATRITHSQCDGVVFSNLGRMDLIAKDLQSQGFQGKKLSILIDKTRLESAGEALKGLVYATHQSPTNSFIAAFKREFREDPGVSSNTAYDALMLYAKAINAAATDNVSVIKEVLKNISIEGASGRLQYDSRGGIVREPNIGQIK